MKHFTVLSLSPEDAAICAASRVRSFLTDGYDYAQMRELTQLRRYALPPAERVRRQGLLQDVHLRVLTNDRFGAERAA